MNAKASPLVSVRSVGTTQQWPTELTGRCSTYWLSIHRSSPCAPSGFFIRSSEITPGTKKTITRIKAPRCVRLLSAGNSTSTGTDTASTWSCCYIQQTPEGWTPAAICCSPGQSGLQRLQTYGEITCSGRLDCCCCCGDTCEGDRERKRERSELRI